MLDKWQKKEKPMFTMLGLGGGNASNSLGVAIGDPLTASGGTTNDYTENGNPYRSHTFLADGSFNVSALGTGIIGDKIDCMVVGGGGGGGHNWDGGGGAGGMRVFTDVPVTTGNYGVTIGAGGAGDPYPTLMALAE